MTIGGLVLAAAMALSLALAPAPAAADSVVSLRGSNNIPGAPEAPRFFKAEVPDKAFARAHKGAPPLVSHEIDLNDKKYAITLKRNGCLKCHDKSVTDKEKAPKLSTAHYKAPNGVIGETVFKGRYYCIQCHVPQLKTKPLVANSFVGSK
tara:strand:+ start:793 stop:1242 length:450 start_codon:yes stop_codon:yes gene_type:complete